MFMYHDDTANVGKAYCYAKGWKGCRESSAGVLAEYLKKYMVSNCLWKGGDRGKANFVIATWLALDFDEGITLEEGIEAFKPYMHVIGTTRNHQKPKGKKPACDRFRVFLKLLDPIYSSEQLEETQRQWAKKYGADMHAVDAGRLFYPCKEIIVVKYHGEPVHGVDMLEIEKKRKRKAAAIKRANQKWLRNYSENRTVPTWIKNKLKFGVSSGSRNTFCFQIGAELTKSSYSESEILDLVAFAPASIIANDFPLEEARKAIRSGMRK